MVRAQPDASDHGATLTADDLTEVLVTSGTPDPFLTQLGLQVHKWDAAPAEEDWTGGTEPSTEERRARICELLGMNEAGAAALREKRSIYHDRSVVITLPRMTRWYTAERADAHGFYWPLYRDYLLNVRRWKEDSVSDLDTATTQIVERLAEPTNLGAYQSKGLVVGYVQSGKTANFTGVTAKAVDAGYRLVVVMTGTIEMLRAQTQRRIDMELVGRQNILGDFSPKQAIASGIIDYQDDLAWLQQQFLDLGEADPSTPIVRLTRHHRDYQSQFRTLRIERVEPGRPLFDPENLYRSGARLAIVKKNAAVLKKLVNDIRANANAFSEIPVLIIDDESDQASVNTVDPAKVQDSLNDGTEIARRRAINELIATMLDLMPRAQYVGYTATPFANVFVDPADPLGIFPKDFVIGLAEPPGYMGVRNFHDFDRAPDEGPGPNEQAFVRHLEAGDKDLAEQERELARAIDMFVLTGAVKLWRKDLDPSLQYRHHTMLVHSSVSTAAHRELADAIKRIWKERGYSDPLTKERLRNLYESDVLPVSAVQLEEGVAPPPPFESLIPWLAGAVAKITEHSNNPVIVVNSDKDIQIQQQELDFDRYDIWRILVGGAKLSRGFTVEGLTVTYFRRATALSDSLTQMGRWFGFRAGYRDLVRLFIARKASFGSKSIDLYEAFEGVALDEAAFREQLSAYAGWDGDSPRLRPIEIPPLVTQHLPWLKPTSRDKMFNAVLEMQGDQTFTATGLPLHPEELKDNLNLWRPILQRATERAEISGAHGSNYEALVGVAPAQAIVKAIQSMKYLYRYGPVTVDPHVRFYRNLIESGDLSDFLVVLPQPDVDRHALADGVGVLSVVQRDRREGRGGKFGEITDPKHRPPIYEFVNGLAGGNLRPFYEAHRGAVLLYLIDDRDRHGTLDEEGLVLGYSVYLPGSSVQANQTVLKFRVHNPDQEDDATVDANRETP